MQSYTRRQLKEDKFQEVTREAIAQAAAHRRQIIIIGSIVIAVVIAAGAYYYLHTQQSEKASTAFGQAMTTFSAPIREAGAAVDPSQLSFATTDERDTAAAKQFQAVADQYPHTTGGHNALYMVGVAALDAGQYQQAETKFKEAADRGGKEVASLAKMGLASAYVAQGRDQDAVNIYNDLLKNPTISASHDRVQLALATLYEKKNPAQAKKIYDQLAADKISAVAEIAKQREGLLPKQ